MNDDFSRWIEDHLFTPTELENYLDCRFRFYAESFLGLKPLPEWEIEMTPAEVGDSLHRILARYRPGQGQKLPEVADQLLEEFRQGRPGLSLPLFERKKKAIRKTLEEFLDAEKEPRGSLTLAHTEWSFAPLELPDGDRRIRIRGRIDRIDVDHRKKQFLVIDYKTGSTTPTGAAIERGESLQLPLYLLAVKELLFPSYEPIGGLYYRLADMRLEGGILHADRASDLVERLRIGARSSSLIPAGRWPPLFKTTEATVRRLVESIRQGDFAPDPENCTPTCPFKEICLLKTH